MKTFERSIDVGCSAAALFDFHAAPGAFARLTPPFAKAQVVSPLHALENGERATIDVGLFGPIRSRWVARHEDVVVGRGFVDVMEGGPFKSWRHEHIFEPIDDQHCRLVDRIAFDGPVFGLGDGFVLAQLNAMFRYRHKTTVEDARLLSTSSSKVLGRRLRVGITGASGLIGAELSGLLSVLGHEAVPFVRGLRIDEGKSDARVGWDPTSGTLCGAMNGLDAVVHLAGENIAAGRLTTEKRARLHEGRVVQTNRLLEALLALSSPPRVIVAASAVGIYGDCGSDVVDEDSAGATGAQANFLATLCEVWEAAGLQRTAPWRAVAVRIGIAQSLRGGALQRLAPVFRSGGGAVLGDGRGYTTPIAVDDVAAIVVRALTDDTLRGPVNCVPAEPVTQQTYASTLASVLSRPLLLGLPRLALQIAFGELGERLLDSQRVKPTRLLTTGHRWRHADLEAALRHQLGR